MNATIPTTLNAKISKNNQSYPESAIISAEKGEKRGNCVPFQPDCCANHISKAR